MTTPPLPSMNAMVDAVTDAVEAAIARGNSHPGGVRRFILQGAIRRVLRDIGQHRIALRRHLATGPNAGGRPSTPRQAPRSSRTQYTTGVCPRHGPTTFVRRVGATLLASPKPSSLPKPSPFPTPTPTASSSLLHPWNGGGGPATARRNDDMLAWPSGFAYDFDVALNLPPSPPALSPIRTPSTRGRSYAVVTAAHRDGHRSALPPADALGAGFVSSSVKGEATGRS